MTGNIAHSIMEALVAGDLLTASGLVTEHMPTEQNNPEFLFMAARTARELRDLTSAKKIFARLLAMTADNSNVHELGYKIMYDDVNLPEAMKHVALGAQSEPANPFLKQLALLQVVHSNVQDHWLGKLCQELLTTPQLPQDHLRTASILISARLYDIALPFLDQGLTQLARTPDGPMHRDAFINDKYVVAQLRAGNPISFPERPDDAEWQAFSAQLAPLAVDTNAQPKATIIVTSHISSKLSMNAHKAPPSTQLLQETLASFRQHAQLPRDWPMIICFDAPKVPQPDAEAAYLEALKPICAEYNASVRTYRGAGLRHVFLDVFKDIETPYFMMLEHDWLCARDVEPLPALTALLDATPSIHHVRYPRHHSHLNESDWYLVNEPNRAMPLMHTPMFSNNPNLTRTAKFARDWLPLIAHNSQYDAGNGGAGGVEEAIIYRSFRAMQRWGLFANMAAQGTCIIGRANDEPRIIHTGI